MFLLYKAYLNSVTEEGKAMKYTYLKISIAFLSLAFLCLLIACILFFTDSEPIQKFFSSILFLAFEDCTPSLFGTFAAALSLPALTLAYKFYETSFYPQFEEDTEKLDDTKSNENTTE